MQTRVQRQPFFWLELGKRLARARRAEGFSQGALGLAAGLDRKQLGMIEKGRRTLDVRECLILAERLHITPSHLLANLWPHDQRRMQRRQTA